MKDFPLSAERIESLKAGILAAFSFTIAYGLLVVVNNFLLFEQFEVFALLPSISVLEFTSKIAIAFLSGFLFGITYRYIIREDKNPHLKDGAVLAFALVRGLATIEAKQNLSELVWLLGLLTIESIVCFAIARLALDSALHYHLLKPFRNL
ncbi:MAG: hypothetical protein WA919_01515 [Coleofasciculaceae cyanobacterium]